MAKLPIQRIIKSVKGAFKKPPTPMPLVSGIGRSSWLSDAVSRFASGEAETPTHLKLAEHLHAHGIKPLVVDMKGLTREQMQTMLTFLDRNSPRGSGHYVSQGGQVLNYRDQRAEHPFAFVSPKYAVILSEYGKNGSQVVPIKE